VRPPGQLLCAGANYFKHIRQIAFSFMKNEGDPRPDEEIRAEADEITRRRHEEEDPFVFTGLTSALSGARDDVVLWGPGEQHDWELELAVVIGRHARNVSVDDAMEHVAGYTMSNDVSTRDVMHRPRFPMTDFIMTKSRPTFFPTGPYFVPREFVPDPRALRIRLSVNGEVMQDESVDDIIYGVEELVSYASAAAELYPGDLLLTGSPAGNAGHHGNRWLRPGDVMEGEITGLGRQVNRCVAPPA
jgi:2-keto-4-pentenoate hydratase/2-oxohepta-3-ene-1,7-dioic acid hydratase in catechol pathway